MNYRNQRKRNYVVKKPRIDSLYKLMALLFLVCTVLLSAKLTAGVSGQALKNAVLQRPSVYVGLRLNGQML